MSQRANENENKGDLGTSKSAEGRMEDKIFQQCVDEGCFIETNFQDQDSNAYNTLTKYFPDAAYHCSGHVNRSFGNQLEKYSQIKNSDKNELEGEDTKKIVVTSQNHLSLVLKLIIFVSLKMLEMIH